jgi:signal transduction histidine kinase
LAAHPRQQQGDPLTIKTRVLAIGLIPSVALILAGAGVLLTSTGSGGAALLALGLLVLLAVLQQVGVVNRRFAQLRRDVLDLADRAVPDVVRRLLAGEHVDLDAEIPWLHGGSDEIGQVALAFNRAGRTAIAATMQESETRRGARNVFLNIAHRNQVVVHRQLAALDRAERSEDDPDQLDLLFKLDHLATRGRRNAENLIILNGGQPGRQWRKPVPLHRIVDGAIAETEQYTRVDAVRLPETPMVGSVVADLAHLLAELVDNATAFSPPHTRVEVRGNAVSKGMAIKIEDQGLGLDPEYMAQVNAMMRTPPEFGGMALSGDSRLGMFVVARLAARHDMKVTLQDSAYGGTSAVVLIPNELIDTSAEPSAQPALANHASTEPTGAAPLDGPDADTSGLLAVSGESSTDMAEAAENSGEWLDPAPEGTSADEQGSGADQSSPSDEQEADRTPQDEAAAAPTAEDEAPLPRRRPRESLPAQLRGNLPPQEPDNARDAEFTHLAMTAFQRGTREARRTATTKTPAGSGEHHDHEQAHSQARDH